MMCLIFTMSCDINIISYYDYIKNQVQLKQQKKETNRLKMNSKAFDFLINSFP